MTNDKSSPTPLEANGGAQNRCNNTQDMDRNAEKAFGAAPLLDPRFESYPQINSGLLSINAKPQVIEFFAAHPERWNINGATKMNAILSRYSEIVNSQQPSGDKNQEIHNPANAQLKTLY